MIDKSTCKDYVMTFFNDKLFSYTPIVEIAIAVILLLGIMSVIIAIFMFTFDTIVDITMPDTLEKAIIKYVKILCVLCVLALVLRGGKTVIVKRQYLDIITENITDIQSNMYLVQNETRGYSRGGSFVINDDKDGKYKYTVFISKDNEYYYIELEHVKTHVIVDESIQGVKYELSLENNELSMTKYIGSNT